MSDSKSASQPTDSDHSEKLSKPSIDTVTAAAPAALDSEKSPKVSKSESMGNKPDLKQSSSSKSGSTVTVAPAAKSTEPEGNTEQAEGTSEQVEVTDSIEVLVNFLNIVGATVYSKLLSVQRDEDGDYSVPAKVLTKNDYTEAGIRKMSNHGDLLKFRSDFKASESESKSSTSQSQSQKLSVDAQVTVQAAAASASDGSDYNNVDNKSNNFPDLDNLPTSKDGALVGFSIISIDSESDQPQILRRESKVVLMPGLKQSSAKEPCVEQSKKIKKSKLKTATTGHDSDIKESESHCSNSELNKTSSNASETRQSSDSDSNLDSDSNYYSGSDESSNSFFERNFQVI